jgi:hypothetical protein
MSLVNDALKKARQARPADSASARGPDFLPPQPVSQSRRTRQSLPLKIGFAAVVAIAVVLFWEWSRGSASLVVRAHAPPAPTLADAPATLSDVSIAPSNAIASAPVTVADPAPTNSLPPAPVQLAVAAQPPIPNPIPAPEAAPVPEEAAPDLKLQGIFYEPRRPAAVINGSIVHVGSQVDDARVVAIDLRSATVRTPSGRNYILRMEND